MASFLTYLTTRPFLFESENELIVMREFCLCALPFVHIYFVITSLKEKRVNGICSRITEISLRGALWETTKANGFSNCFVVIILNTISFFQKRLQKIWTISRGT
jgi:hypothetical protein